VVQAYAVKHNPFAYFKNVQEGYSSEHSLSNVVGFDGPRGLYADLATGNVPSFSFIVPNQCDDQHGRGNGDAFCAFDPGLPPGSATVGTTAGLNPGLIQQGDVTIERLVEGIKASPVWNEGRNAIVIVWDENDYSGLLNNTNGVFPPQNQNNVVLTVEINREGENGVKKQYLLHQLLFAEVHRGSIGASLPEPCLRSERCRNVGPVRRPLSLCPPPLRAQSRHQALGTRPHGLVASSPTSSFGELLRKRPASSCSACRGRAQLCD